MGSMAVSTDVPAFVVAAGRSGVNGGKAMNQRDRDLEGGVPQHSSQLLLLPWDSEPIWHGLSKQDVSSPRVEALRLLLSEPPCLSGCVRCADVESVYGMELARELALVAAYSEPPPLEGGF